MYHKSSKWQLCNIFIKLFMQLLKSVSHQETYKLSINSLIRNDVPYKIFMFYLMQPNLSLVEIVSCKYRLKIAILSIPGCFSSTGKCLFLY